MRMAEGAGQEPVKRSGTASPRSMIFRAATNSDLK